MPRAPGAAVEHQLRAETTSLKYNCQGAMGCKSGHAMDALSQALAPVAAGLAGEGAVLVLRWCRRAPQKHHLGGPCHCCWMLGAGWGPEVSLRAIFSLTCHYQNAIKRQKTGGGRASTKHTTVSARGAEKPQCPLCCPAAPLRQPSRAKPSCPPLHQISDFLREGSTAPLPQGRVSAGLAQEQEPQCP